MATNAVKKVSHKITDAQKSYLLSLKPEDITFPCFVSLFGNVTDTSSGKTVITPSRFNTTDIMTLSPTEYFVPTKTDTTVGKFIFNKYIIEPLKLQPITGYVNYQLDKKGYNKLESIMATALLEDKITPKIYHDFINLRDTIGFQFHTVITYPFSDKFLKLPPEVQKNRKELYKKYEKELNAGDIGVITKIENQLTKEAREALKDETGMGLFNSGAKSSFENNYKNINICKGPVYNNLTKRYDFVGSSLMDGIAKKDIPPMANNIITGGYPKAIGTAVSGYLAKQILQCMQTESLAEEGTDCGTKRTLEVELDASNAKDFHYRFIMEGSKLVELTPQVISTYIGKKVNLRSPMFCRGVDGCICSKCAGTMYYRIGLKHIGLSCSRIATACTGLNMKKFHDSTIHSRQINIDDMLI